MPRELKQETLRVRCTTPFKRAVDAKAVERDTTSSALTREALYDKYPELKVLASGAAEEAVAAGTSTEGDRA